MSIEDKLRRALAALKPFADAYPTDGRYLNPVRLIYSDGAKGSLAVEDFGDAHDTYEALAATQEQRGEPGSNGTHLAFLEEAARFFESRSTGGEDAAFWANVQNAENCRRAAKALRSAPSVSGGDTKTIRVEQLRAALKWIEEDACTNIEAAAYAREARRQDILAVSDIPKRGLGEPLPSPPAVTSSERDAQT